MPSTLWSTAPHRRWDCEDSMEQLRWNFAATNFQVAISACHLARRTNGTTRAARTAPPFGAAMSPLKNTPCSEGRFCRTTSCDANDAMSKVRSNGGDVRVADCSVLSQVIGTGFPGPFVEGSLRLNLCWFGVALSPPWVDQLFFTSSPGEKPGRAFIGLTWPVSDRFSSEKNTSQGGPWL